VLVHAIDEVGNPADAGLEKGDAKTRVSLEHAPAHRRRHRRHHVERKADAVHLDVVVEAIHADLGEVHAGRPVDPDRHVQILRGGVEAVEVAVIQISLAQGGRHAHADQSCFARLGEQRHRRLDVLDGHDRHAEQPSAGLLAPVRDELVVECREAGRELEVGEARNRQPQAREEHHLLDALAVGVGQHAIDRARIDAGRAAHAVLGRAARAGTLELGIATPLDEEAAAAVLAATKCHRVRPALQRLDRQGGALDHVGIGVDDGRHASS
jgi:hypothetical protein